MWRTLTSARFLTRLMVVGGLALRVWHYAANHTIWFDEAVLLLNVLDLSYAELLGPTKYAVAAPPLFLWLLKTIAVTVGDVPYLWRLVPFAFGVGGLLLTVPLARRVFPPHLAAFAVGLVAVSDNHIWLGCNIKPYAGDTAVVTALLLYLAATPHWTAARRLLVLAAATPLLFGFSYTAVFGVGAVLLAWLPAALRQRSRGWVAWGVAAAVAAGVFAALHFGPMKAQRLPSLVHEWRIDFPNYDDPWAVPGWVLTHTLGVCVQACKPSGLILGLLAPLGVWGLWRGGRKELAAACVLLFGLAVAAAGVKAYPYGEHRLSQFLAPAVLTLGVAGVGEVARWRKWVGVGLAVLILGVADALTLSMVVNPWSRPASASVYRHVQHHRRPGEPLFSDDGCYMYYFRGEVRPLVYAGEVPVGGRAWVLMDFFTNDDAREGNERSLTALGFEVRQRAEFHRAEAWLWERK